MMVTGRDVNTTVYPSINQPVKRGIVEKANNAEKTACITDMVIPREKT
eukprot:XP_001707955.1 Hypothetical protein GL50803_35669 [Giardia lamblia ATCC 50803]